MNSGGDTDSLTRDCTGISLIGSDDAATSLRRRLGSNSFDRFAWALNDWNRNGQTLGQPARRLREGNLEVRIGDPVVASTAGGIDVRRAELLGTRNFSSVPYTELSRERKQSVDSGQLQEISPGPRCLAAASPGFIIARPRRALSFAERIRVTPEARWGLVLSFRNAR